METIPRWTLEPVPGLAEHQVPLPEGTSVRPPDLAAAHARVLTALTGEQTDYDPALQVTVTDGILRLHYRTDVLDAEAAARIAGYHLTALTEPDRLARWIGRSAYVLAAINLAFVPSLFFGNTPAHFYAANGWGTTALMGAILSYWLLAVGISTYRNSSRPHRTVAA